MRAGSVVVAQVLRVQVIQRRVDGLFPNGKGFMAMVATDLHNLPPIPGFYGKISPGEALNSCDWPFETIIYYPCHPGRFRKSAGMTDPAYTGRFSFFFHPLLFLNYTTLLGQLKVIIYL
jgi:hypothetical protein